MNLPRLAPEEAGPPPPAATEQPTWGLTRKFGAAGAVVGLVVGVVQCVPEYGWDVPGLLGGILGTCVAWMLTFGAVGLVTDIITDGRGE